MIIKAILILISVTGIVNAAKTYSKRYSGTIQPVSGTCNIAQSDSNGWQFTPTNENATEAAKCLGLTDTSFASYESAKPYFINDNAVFAAKITRHNDQIFYIVDAGSYYHVYQ